jgi:hypothetical protein
MNSNQHRYKQTLMLNRKTDIIKYDDVCSKQLMNQKRDCYNYHPVVMVHFKVASYDTYLWY